MIRQVSPNARVGLEAALLAHVLVNPTMLPRTVIVSPACARVLHVLVEDPYAAYGLTAAVRAPRTGDTFELREAAVDLADVAASMTAQDLATVGDVAMILALLAPPSVSMAKAA